MNNHTYPKAWETFRLSCLAMVGAGAVVALGVGLTTPLQPRPAIAPYTFPVTIPLSGWQSVKHYSLPATEDKNLTPLASQGYQYQRNGKTLTIEMRYLTTANGDVNQFMSWYTNIPPSVKTERHQQKGRGSYLLLTYQDKVYLSSCINVQGASTATRREYLQSKLLSGLNLQQFFAWLVGQDSLFDQRCLWSYLSLPVQSSLPEARQTLEESWGLWYDHWQSSFPVR